MKKTYIEPNTLVVVLDTKTTLLAGSDPKAQALSIEGESIDNGNLIGTRRMNSVWDEEDEE